MTLIHPTRILELDLCGSCLGIGIIPWRFGVLGHRTIQSPSVIGEPLFASLRLPDGSDNALSARITVGCPGAWLPCGLDVSALGALLCVPMRRQVAWVDAGLAGRCNGSGFGRCFSTRGVLEADRGR